MFVEKLQSLEQKYEELSAQLGDPELIASPERYQKTARAHSELEEVVDKYRRYRSVLNQIQEAERILEDESDEEMIALAEQELTLLRRQQEAFEGELRLLLLPRDPNDAKNVILEIRAGTGGSEASLFANDIFRMYSRYAESRGWKIDIISASYSAVGGLKEIIALVEGRDVFSRLKFESGVHRVQRVPETEAQGRVHTSAVTVAVLPEADEVELQIDPKDLRIDTYCSSGPGGQSVNTTYSAVRITHIPTGEVVTCQDEKSQIKNKAKALKVLRSRLYEKALQEQQKEIAQNRRAMVGSGDRSEKIRTYNFPQNRVTDHRIGLTLHRLENVVEGDLEEIIDALVTSSQAESLKERAAV
jgi:peptide chain release factor 1